MFGRATITLGIGPHSSLLCFSGDDISKPLKHSFIHTGHADATGKLWGDPGQIDEYVLCHLSPFCSLFFIHTLLLM